MGESLAGRLLVATPKLQDPNFARAVVLLLAHDENGALGVVLNRPLELPLAEPLPQWAPLASAPAVLFRGGPVEPTTALAVVRWLSGAEAVDGWTAMAGGFGVLDLTLGPEAFPVDDLEGLRVFSGYAGWGAGQLEGEIDEGAWFVVAPEPDDVFGADADGLWRRVLRRQPGHLAMFAFAPLDPSVN